MNLLDLIRKTVREELSPTNMPLQAQPPTVQAASDWQASFARVNAHKEALASIDARRSECFEDERRIAELRIELNERCQRVEAHHSQLQAEYFATDCALERELALLRSVCSPQIIRFIEWANEEQSRLMLLKVDEHFSYGERNLLVDNASRPIELFSNGPAITRRLKAVVSARTRAEELKILDRTEEEIYSELEGLKSTLPQIDGVLEQVRY